MVSRRVLRGARWLDKVSPGWHTRIDLMAFTVTSPWWNVLAQVRPLFMGYFAHHSLRGGLWCRRRGFDLAACHQEWVELISQRQVNDMHIPEEATCLVPN